jgi:hypothetical protein
MFFFYFLLIRVFFFFFFVIIMNLRNILLFYVNHIMSIHIASYRLCLNDVCLGHIATRVQHPHISDICLSQQGNITEELTLAGAETAMDSRVPETETEETMVKECKEQSLCIDMD